MASEWREVIGASMDESHNAPVEWVRAVPEPDDVPTEDDIKAEDPHWTPPPDLWRPRSSLGPVPPRQISPGT